MSLRKALLMLNPNAGKRASRGQIFSIVDGLTREGWEVTVYPTQSQGDARRMARERGGDFELMICSGGDGTLSEVVSGVLSGGHEPVLGYLPTGTTNDFAACLGLPRKTPDALKVITRGEINRIDAGLLNDEQHFIYLAAFGLLTDVSYTTPQDQKNALGRAAYFIEGIKRLPQTQSCPMRISAGNLYYEGDFMLGVVLNSTGFGGLFHLDEENVFLDDGYFEVMLIRDPGSPAALTRLMVEVLSQVYDEDYVHLFRAQSITFESDQSVSWCLDGESGGEHHTARIENLKQAYRLTTGSK